ncbi:hypothetical protein ES702_03383 [subsurface metagenome]
MLNQTYFWRPFSIIILLCFSFVCAFGADVNWDDGGDQSSWSDPLNWDTDMVPTINDKVHIIGTFTVNINIPEAFAQIVDIIGGAVLNVSAGTHLKLSTEGLMSDYTILRVGSGSAGTVINRGTIEIITNPLVAGDIPIEVRLAASRFENYGLVFITARFQSQAALNAIMNSTIINRGGISIEGNFDSNQIVKAIQGGDILNSGLIRIQNLTGTIDESLFAQGVTGTVFHNELCGVINNLTNFPMSFSVISTSINDGIITSQHTGNGNSGTITNNGQIRTPDGTFNTATVLVNPPTTGAIPATSSLSASCPPLPQFETPPAIPPPAIPTLSQWGLIILGICLLVMGTVALQSRHVEM